MNYLARKLQDIACKHKKVMHSAHHGLHCSYLGAYVWDWHVPISPIALALLLLAIGSWAFHLELD